MSHPAESDLALVASGDLSRWRFLRARHVKNCAECRAKVAAYRDLREELADVELPGVNWNALASEMRANIRVGLEAGACVRTSRISSRWEWARAWAAAVSPRALVGYATVALLVASGFYMRDLRPRAAADAAATPVVQTTSKGVEFRTGETSLILLNRSDASNETVSARGDVGVRVLDAGSVMTINNVYLQ